MAKLGLSFKTNGKQFTAIIAGRIKKIEEGFTTAMAQAQAEILRRGQADIKGAGRFGTRWTKGFHVDLISSGQARNAQGQFGQNEDKLTVRHDIPYWTVHQYGKTIHGKPLLWIPLSFSDAVGKRARDYPAPLFRVPKDRTQMRRKGGGAPLLLSSKDGEPKYSGHQSVTIPKRFKLVEIAREVASKIVGFMKQTFKG